MEVADNLITLPNNDQLENESDMNVQEQLKQLSSYISKLMSQKFGRGPESCHSAMGHRYLVVHLRGFLSPMEEVLIQHGEAASVDRTRTIIVSSMLQEIKGVVHVSLGLEIESYYQDWNYATNAGMVVAVLSQESPAMKSRTLEEANINIMGLREEINRISAFVQKVPDELTIYPISLKLIVVIRSGIMVPIERALYERGFERELKMAKADLEKSHFLGSTVLRQLLDGEVENIFMDWNFLNDDSLMCFQFK